jgi:anaerobic ribonucleoside-triphosphate reductase activating protein
MSDRDRQFTIRIAGVVHESIVDGPGIRLTLFFQGCPHACPGCHNPQTWDPRGGIEYTLAELTAKLQPNPLEQGITFSGGEPFCQAEGAAKLAAYYRDLGLSLWIYTGFLWEELLMNLARPGYRKLLQLAEVIVDGPFRRDLKQLGLVFRGSANQRLIKVRESLATQAIIEWRSERAGILK